MLKKVLIFISCLILLISTVGCKGDNNDSKGNASGNYSSKTNSSEDTNSNGSSGNDFVPDDMVPSVDGVVSNNTSASTNNVSSNKPSSSNNSSGKTSSSSSGGLTLCKHTYTAADCEQPKECKDCGYVASPALGHNFVNGVCSVCKVSALKWYTEGNVTITKSEVDQILNMQFKKPKNVIYMIGDGMGPNDIAYTQKVYSSYTFDFGLVLNQIKNTGFATTYSADNSVTDSAASGTALATGVKTKNGYVGISPTRETLTNVTEIARQKGKKVGVVTNDDMTGATPAAFLAHNSSRENESAIINSYISFAPDVLIGRGYDSFKSMNLSNFVLADDFSKFDTALNSNIKCTRPFMGFFEINTSVNTLNTLSYCTEVALNRLSKNSPNGFFLMIENTTCDTGGHYNSLDAKKNGVVNLDRAVATVLKFMKNNPDTLLVITSDHDCGGLQIDGKFTTTSHTGIDVRTFAVGYGAEYFNNKTVDNTDIAKFVIDAVSK